MGTIEYRFGFIRQPKPQSRRSCDRRGNGRLVASIAWALPGHQGDLLDLASDKDRKTSSKKASEKGHGKDRDTGAALRSAYQKTVDESVPDEMLDLLSKLA